MAKKKQEVAINSEDDDFFNDIRESGGKSLTESGKINYFLDTGNLALNYISSGKFIPGGLPSGKIVEIYGPPATSKSLLGMGILAACQRIGGISVLLDCERAGNPDFASVAAHVDSDKLVTYEPTSIEECERKIKAVTTKVRARYGKDKPLCFLWDSITASPTEREWKEIDLPETYTDQQFKTIVGSHEKPGERARAAGDFLRVMNAYLSDNDATLIIINQIRSKIGVFWGSPDTRGAGGRSIEYYVSCIFKTSSQKTIEDKQKGIPLGVNLTFANEKNRCFVPKLKTNGVQLFFSAGINPLGGLLSVFLMADRIKMEKAGYYRVLEPYAEGKDHVFQSSATRNDVPLDTILQFPKLVDASSVEEVNKYLSTYQGALELAGGGTIVEKDIEQESGETPA